MGWGTRRISDFLNSNKIKTFNGLTWTPKLVYMNRQKYLKRLKRLEDYKIINVKEQLVVRPVKIVSIYNEKNIPYNSNFCSSIFPFII